jgi:hypothetical protein
MNKKMTDDSSMVSHLRSYAHWTTEQPWKSIADRFEELVNLSNSKEHENEQR